MMRCRITYQKTEALRYTGNLDMQKIWERYVRRAGLPVAYSQGFHPQARIQQACPLPLGFLSTNEQLDLFLDDDTITTERVAECLANAPYPGITISDIQMVEISDQSLASRVVSGRYRAEFLDSVDLPELEKKVETLLRSSQLIRTRREKTYDLRPLVEEIIIEMDESPALSIQLSARQGATGRPEEVLSALGFDPYSARYTRTRIIYND